jgi:Lipocalin-like domain
VGFLTYTPEDRVAVIISYGGRKPLSLAATIEEQAEAYKTFVGYAGRYALRDGRITHFVEISSIQSFVSKELIRIIKFEGDRITLVTPPAVVNGKLQSVRLTWERLTAKS